MSGRDIASNNQDNRAQCFAPDLAKKIPSKHLKVGHHQPASETPFTWRFADGMMVVQYCVLAGYWVTIASQDFS